MDINRDELIKDLNQIGIPIIPCGMMTDIIRKVGLPVDYTKNVEKIFKDKFEHLDGVDFMLHILALIDIYYDKDKNITDVELEEEPGCEPECDRNGEDDEIECEFVNRQGNWWCNTHNCYA